jgi:homoserine O-acetyltransferase/O-succinyltransferase
VLASGARLGPVEVAYETYGTLDAARSNAVYVCHALTGDAHAAGHHGNPARPGWWDNLIGPGRPLDTDRYFVVCSNILGGCQGTTGPGSPDPATGRPYGLRFPLLGVSDLVDVHRALVAHLGVERLLGAIGGSLGGMQVLQWAMDQPGEIAGALVVAASARLSAQNIAFSAVAREAIMRDPDFAGGDYYGAPRPDRGLMLARMIAHITYLSEASMREKFGRRIQDATEPRYGFDVDFEVESYLEHQGRSFVGRFDANTYLYLTRVMDYFDPFGGDPAALSARLAQVDARFLVLSFDSDWRFSTAHARDIVRTLSAARVPVTFREVSAPHGHDSFLMPVPEYHRTIAGFLDRLAAEPA